MQGKIELKNVSKSPYFNKINFSFAPGAGKVISIYGNDSSALTYLLKVISGLMSFDSGDILYNGTKSLPVFPFIPKKPSSFPWASVKENVESVPDRKKEVQSVINAVGLQGYENHFPDEKSIGFRFRISLARALSLEPALIIIDNSFSETYIETKEELFTLIKDVSVKQGVTFLYSTTNINDAVSAGNEVIALNKIEDLQKIVKDGYAG